MCSQGPRARRHRCGGVAYASPPSGYPPARTRRTSIPNRTHEEIGRRIRQALSSGRLRSLGCLVVLLPRSSRPALVRGSFLDSAPADRRLLKRSQPVTLDSWTSSGIQIRQTQPGQAWCHLPRSGHRLWGSAGPDFLRSGSLRRGGPLPDVRSFERRPLARRIAHRPRRKDPGRQRQASDAKGEENL